MIREQTGSPSGGGRCGPERADHGKEVEAIATALGFATDDWARVFWRSLNLHRVGHRGSNLGPRRVDGDFRSWWEDVQTLLLRLGRQFESSFTASLPLIDELASIERPDRSDVTRLGQVPHSVVALHRFFERAGPGWFPALRRKGYLSDPPALAVAEDGTVAYVRWPAGRYLARMASEPSIHGDLVEVVLELHSDNPEAHESAADAALALPTEEAARIAPKIGEFLGATYQWAQPFKARDLLIRLADEQQADACRLLMRAMVQSEAQRGWWHSTGMAAEIVPAVIPLLGTDALEIIADALDEVLDERWPNSGARQDFSLNWRPTIDGERDRDHEGVLVSALRDAAILIARSNEPGVQAVVEALERRQRAIFHRIGLHVLRYVPEERLIAERLSRRELFDDPHVEREYTLLLREHGAIIPQDVRTGILTWIDAGPQETDGDPDTDERWRLFQLARFGDALPEKWTARYHELVARFGEPVERWARSRIGAGHAAPMTADEILASSDDDLVEFLRTWQPDHGWLTPSREGLSESLEQATAKAPGRFAKLAPTFAELHPAYAFSLINGLRKATKDSASFPWRRVLEMSRAILEKSGSQSGYSPEQHGDDQYRGWSGMRQDVARLMEDGLRHEAIAPDSDGEVFEILAQLATDPDPSRKDEQRRRAAGETWPATLDLNTTRGTTFHAVMQYAWWHKKRTPRDETPRLTSELRNLLDRHANPFHEPTETIRSIYGQYFPALMACDEEWARSRVDAIFPRDPSLEPLRLAAWEGYLIANRPSSAVYELLAAHYREAVSRLSADDAAADDSSGRAAEIRDALLAHILRLYAQDVIDLEPGGLVDLFVAQAPVSMRKRFIHLVGFDLGEEQQPAPTALTRLRRLWEWRLAALEQREQADLGELSGFGWWFASGHFDEEWALTQLHRLLTAKGTIVADHPVIERLAALRHKHLRKVVACLGLVIDAAQLHKPPTPWFVSANQDEIKAILEDGTTTDDPGTTHLALEIVNRLIARGHTQFEELLPPTRTHPT
jgi:hypothetical protein